MTAVNGKMIVKGEQLLVDTFHQYIKITCGEVSAADAVLEKHIARQDEFLGIAYETKTAVHVAGGVYRFKLGVAEPDQVPVFNKDFLTLAWFHDKTINLTLSVPLLKKWQSCTVQFRLQAIGFNDEIIPQDVVHMAMGVDQPNWIQTLIGNKFR